MGMCSMEQVFVSQRSSSNESYLFQVLHRTFFKGCTKSAGVFSQLNRSPPPSRSSLIGQCPGCLHQCGQQYALACHLVHQHSFNVRLGIPSVQDNLQASFCGITKDLAQSHSNGFIVMQDMSVCSARQVFLFTENVI
jgi:hypothetical protein